MPILEREEYVEQSYFFRVLRERLAEGQPTQRILEQVDQELLSTTRLPMAVQFLTTEVKHSGLLSTGFRRLPHYFTPFQAFVVENSEDETKRFSAELALLVLEREAFYRAGAVSAQGLFVFQFEVICRNRLGYDTGLRAMRGDPHFDADWSKFLDLVFRQLGMIELAELLYVCSAEYVREQQREDPEYHPPIGPFFGEKEGRIARANIGRDPLYLFAALQRHLGYPEVPSAKPPDDINAKMEILKTRVRDLESRMKLLESEIRGTLDLSKLIDPEKLRQQFEKDDW